MQKDPSFWSEWAHFLQRTEFIDLAAEFLEAAGPVNVILAQVVHAGSPFLSLLAPAGRLEALAGILEDPEQSRSFAAYLRREAAGKPAGSGGVDKALADKASMGKEASGGSA